MTTQVTLQVPRNNFAPQRMVGMPRGAVLAVLAHVGLIMAIAAGVRWQSSEPQTFSAELWSATPQQAAPAPVEPAVPPPPPLPPAAQAVKEPPKSPETPPPSVKPAEADIAMARQREVEAEKQRKKREEERAERLRKEAEARQQKLAREAEQKAKAEEAKLAKQREDQLARMRALAGATGAATATGSAIQDSAPSAEYGGRIKARIKPKIVLTETIATNPVAEVEVRVASTGRITGRRLVKSSGHKAWDDAVLRAVDATEFLPKDVDGRVPPVILLEFKPNE